MKLKLLFLCMLFVITSGFLIFVNRAGSSQEYSIQVSFIDVGQGDSALIQTLDGYNILIDGGEITAGPIVVSYLRYHGITTLYAVIASHADSDHIGGLISVLSATDILVANVFYNGYPGSTQTWSNFVAAVNNEGLALTALQFPNEINWGMTTAYILNPISGLSNPDTNDASIVMLLAQSQVDFLFTGDIDSSVESEVIARGTPVAADVLKVAHHGSNYGSSIDFLNAVHPSDSVISVGTNSYGHPGFETLARLSAIDSNIWRTDKNGTVEITSADGISYTVFPSITGIFIFLPLVNNNKTESPIPPPSPPPGTGNIVITDIYYDGVGSQEPIEYVQIRNDDTKSIQLEDWTLRDIANHVYTFPNYTIQPGQLCRVYTNEIHPEWCGFSYGYGSEIWNNTGDCAYLWDAQSTPIHDYCY